MRDQYEQDPYAPPPRHKERSGAVVRFVIIAAMLGAAAWGYAEYANNPPAPIVAEEEAAPQQMAQNEGYQTSPSSLAPPSTPTTPQSSPSVNERVPDLPPPTTTSEPPAG